MSFTLIVTLNFSSQFEYKLNQLKKSFHCNGIRLGVVSIVNDEEIYAVGGCDKWSSVVNSAECYNAGNDVWNLLPNMKLKR